MTNYTSNFELYLRLGKERGYFDKFKDAPFKIILDLNIIRREMRKLRKTNPIIPPVGITHYSPWHIEWVSLVMEKDGTYHTIEEQDNVNRRSPVCILPICQGKIVLTKTYRYILGGTIFEIVRGFGESGLTPEENAKKEVLEELGMHVSKLVSLGTTVFDSGVNGTPVHVFVAEVNGVPSTNYQEVGEGIEEIIMVNIKELAKQNTPIDGPTMTALGMYLSQKMANPEKFKGFSVA